MPGLPARPLPAPAKINLFLRVTGVRADGMHELDTAFAYLDLCDELSFEPAGRLEVICSDPDLSGEGNLVHRVLEAFAGEPGVRAAPLRVRIRKRIPVQGGLGGGSSDAATALLLVNRLWRAEWSLERLIDWSARWGADIPCFLFGRASRATGIGERLTPFPHPLPGQPVVLARPGEGLATGEVFRQWDALALTPHGGADTIRNRSGAGGGGALRLGENDLEQAACRLSPAVARLLAALRRETRLAWMSGSGTTCVALADDEAAARGLAARLEREGLASWTHVGRLESVHRLARMHPEYWDVAKR